MTDVASHRILLKRAEAMLLDIAYFEPEIDQTCLMDAEVPDGTATAKRATLQKHMQRLREVFDGIETVPAQRILGRGTSATVLAVPKLLLLLQEVVELREAYRAAVERVDTPIQHALTSAIGKKEQTLLGGSERIVEFMEEPLLHQFCELRLYNLGESLGEQLPGFGEARTPDQDTWARQRRQQIQFYQDDMTTAWRSLLRELAAGYRFGATDKQQELETLLASTESREISGAARQGIQMSEFLKELCAIVEEDCEKTARSDSLKTQLTTILQWLEREDEKRYGILLDIAERMGEISELVYVIGDSNPQIRGSRSMDQLISELGKEPLVRSEFGITEEGVPFVKISLAAYSTHLERKFEVSHKLRKEIQRRFRQAGIEAQIQASQDG